MKTVLVALSFLFISTGMISAAPCHYQLAFDINVDCRVDLIDLSEFASRWLIDCNNEPSSPYCVPGDLDGDGFDISIDCDDNDPNTYPEAFELCDGKDNDCDDLIDEFCELKSNGELCTTENECLSGYCVDGACCDSACDGTCQACSAAKTGGIDGYCASIPYGTDPDEECLNGSCDGSGSCDFPCIFISPLYWHENCYYSDSECAELLGCI
jgi:hypothetical protein